MKIGDRVNTSFGAGEIVREGNRAIDSGDRKFDWLVELEKPTGAAYYNREGGSVSGGTCRYFYEKELTELDSVKNKYEIF